MFGAEPSLKPLSRHGSEVCLSRFHDKIRLRNFARARRTDAMAESLIAKLPEEKRKQLLADLNYLNMAELKSFCQRHSIPYRITIETEDGSTKATSEEDRKGVVLNRIRAFLQKGVIPEETCLTRGVFASTRRPRSLRRMTAYSTDDMTSPTGR